MSQIDDFLDGKSSGQQPKSQIDRFLDDVPAPPGGTMSDLGKSVKAGVQKLPGMVAGLADLPFALAGARPFTNAANALGEATGFTPGKWADETKFSKGYEDGRAAVDAAWKDGSAADIAGAYLTNPGYTANQLAELLPSMVAGGVASKALMGVGRVAGMAADAVAGTAVRAAAPGLLARTVGEKWAVPIAAGVGEGAVTAGQQMAEYQGDDQQKNALASLGAGVGTGLIGAGAGRLANKMGLETAETAMARMGSRAGGAGADVPPSLKRRVLGGMVSEAVLQELPQSAQEQMWNNFANGKPVMEGVDRAGVEGALAGGVMGAGANLRGPGAQPANNAQPAADPAADAPPSPAPQLGYSPLAGTPTVFPDGSVALGSEAELAHRYAPQPVKPSEEMGLNPAAGPLSAAAASAVDNGTYMPPADQAAPAAPEPDPVVLQNRDRTSAASIAQMQDIAANPDYLRVGPSRDMTSGAPVVFGELPQSALLGRPETVVDGKGERMGTQYAVVDAGDLIASNNADGTTVAEYATGAPGKLRSVAGNGRTAGLQAAYQMGTADNYRQELANDAAALGLDPQAVATMQRPVLVRVMQSADVTNDMGDRTNITATQKLSPLEQAGNDARRLDVRTLAFDEGGSPTLDSIKGFVSAMPVAERGDMLNADGTPTRQAVDRLMAATFKQAYDSDELVQLYAQATDPDARAVMAAAADASGVLANLKGAGEFDVRAAVADAAKMAVNAARQGLKLSDVMQNADIDMNPEAFPVAAFMAENIRTPRKMAEGLRRWGQLALEQARIAAENTRQGGMFGAAPTLSRQEIFARLGDGANPIGQGIAPAGPAAVQPAPEQAALMPAPQSNPNVDPNDIQADQAPVERHPNWRKNAIQAGRVARALGLEPKGKRLAQMVAEIDAHDAAIAQPAPAPEAPQLELSAYTADEGRAQIQAQEEADKAQAKQEAQQAATDKARTDKADTDARMDASADNFLLGQDANDAVSGQSSVFDAPAEAAPKTEAANAQPVSATGQNDAKSDADLQAYIALGGVPVGKFFKDEFILVLRAAPNELRDALVDYFKIHTPGRSNFAADAVRGIRAIEGITPLKAGDVLQPYNGSVYRVESIDKNAGAVKLTHRRNDTDATFAEFSKPSVHKDASYVADPIMLGEILFKIEQSKAAAARAVKAQKNTSNDDSWPLATKPLPFYEPQVITLKSGERVTIERTTTEAPERVSVRKDYEYNPEEHDQDIQIRDASGKMIGYISFAPDSESLMSQVDKPWRRKGAGTALYDAAEAAGAVFIPGAEDRLGTVSDDAVELRNYRYARGKKAEAPVNARPAEATPPKKKSVPARKKQEHEAKLAAHTDYFTPGNVVKSYAGHERVVSYSPPDAHGNWSVTVQPVELQGDKWVDVPGAKQSQHSTQPDARALKAGPVQRAPENATENVAAIAQPATAKGQNDAELPADGSTAYSDTPSTKAAATALDKEIMGMANDGRSVRDILRAIQSGSKSKLNRQVAALLLKMQAIPKVEAVGRIYNRDGGLVGGVYQGKTDTVQLSLLGEAGAERTFMHEMVHAATIQSLLRGGMAAQRMKALFARVQKDSALAGEYGVTDVYEFAAELYSNERFRNALNTINEGTLWQNFVNIVRSILGLSTEQRTALSNALMAGQQVMAEDKAIRASAAERAGGQFNAAPMNAQPQDFVPNVDGGLDYGEITPEMGKAMRRQAGKIRLQQGNERFGLAHIEARHGDEIRKAGFASIQEFVADIAKNIDQMWKPDATSQLVALHVVKNDRVMFVQLQPESAGGQDFYTVNTAFPSRAGYVANKKNWKMLWEGRAQPSQSATSEQTPFAVPPQKTGKAATFPSDQSAASVAPKDDNANYARADEGMSPDLARAILALGQPAQSATKESVHAAVRELVNGGGLLPNRLGRVVVATAAEIKAHWEPLIGTVAMESEGVGRAQGFYDPKTKTVFLIADHIQAGDELGVVAHELMHKHGPAVLGEEGWNQLHAAISDWATAPKSSMERKVYDEAASRVQAAGSELSNQELFPYAVQVALEMGVRPNAIAPKGSIERWLGQVRAALRQVWSKIATQRSDFKSLDLVNLAFAIAQRENPATGTSLDAQGATMQDAEAPLFSRAAPAQPTAIQSSMGELTPEQASAYQRVAGTKKVPTLKERFAMLKANFGLKARQALVDQFAAIKQLDQHAYMQARMSKASDGTLEAALLYGKPFMNGGVPDVNMADGGFAKVLASLDGEHDRLLMWVAAQRADRLKAEGKENLMTDDDISSLKTLNAGKMKDGRSRPQVYAKALGEINAYNEAMLKIGMESGLIDQAAYDIMKDQPYVPFYRLMEDDGVQGPRFSSGLTNQQAFKKLKGGSQQLNADLLENMLLSWSSLLQASAKNRAALASMDAAEKMAIAYKVPATTHGKATKGAVKVMRDGVTEHWMVEDPYLLEAIGALHYTVSPLMKPLVKMKQILTMAVTVNPTFKIRNLIRDSISAIAQSELGYNPAANVKNAWKLTASDSQLYASMLAGGGIIKFGTQENTDRLRAQVAKLGGTMLDKTGAQKLMGQVGTLWEIYSEFGDRTENVNRAALYDQLIKKGKSHAEASFMARDLMDFSMGGGMPLVRFLTQTVPFLNARLVGLDKLGRAAMEDPRKFATMAAAVSIASVALMMIYGDDDDWKKREDWDRDTYWWFKVGDKAFRIPKPFEVGAIGTMAERTAELMFSKEMTNKRFAERMAHMFSQTFAFDPVPQAIKPLWDVYSNKDSFTKRAIESQADQRLRPEDRYNERTSEVARLLGQLGLPEPSQLIKGDYVGLSPKQIDHLIRGYFSWAGVTATTAADMLVRPALDRGERPALRLKDAFVIGNFVESLPTGSSRYVSQMYEQSRQVQQAYASYREAVKLGDMDKARSIQAADGDKLRSRIRYDHAAKQMSEINQRAKKVEADRSLSAADKRERLDALEQRRGAIAKRAVERAGV